MVQSLHRRRPSRRVLSAENVATHSKPSGLFLLRRGGTYRATPQVHENNHRESARRAKDPFYFLPRGKRRPPGTAPKVHSCAGARALSAARCARSKRRYDGATGRLLWVSLEGSFKRSRIDSEADRSVSVRKLRQLPDARSGGDARRNRASNTDGGRGGQSAGPPDRNCGVVRNDRLL